MKMKKIVILFAICFILTIFSRTLIAGTSATSNKPTSAPQSVPEYYDLLILGIDRRPHQQSGRSDVILIVHCEPNKITLFSIPRDTVAPIGTKRDKINHAYAFGGLKLAKKTIESFLKFKVDNYVLVDFETFLTTVDVMKKLTDDGRLIGAENFLMSGENLLKWLRFRGLPEGDRRRCQRHQLFIKRVMEYARDMYLHQHALFSQCMKAGLKIVESDMTYEHAEKLMETYKNFDLENELERYVLPGYGKAYYRANEETGDEELSGWYYYAKYNWPLVTYINWYRKNGIRMNYVESDVLRK